MKSRDQWNRGGKRQWQSQKPNLSKAQQKWQTLGRQMKVKRRTKNHQHQEGKVSMDSIEIKRIKTEHSEQSQRTNLTT